MGKVKVLYVCKEMMPYVDETEISSFCRMLPQYIQEKDCDIRTFVPRFGIINERRNQLHEVIRLSGMNITINDSDHQLLIKVASIPNSRVQVYFIDNDDYFHRKAMLHDEDGQMYKDNDERGMFYARGVIETISKLRWSPDIIHCHDWFTVFMPAYIKAKYSDNPLFSSSKIVMSLYDNEPFEGTLDSKLIDKLEMEGFPVDDISIISNPTYNNLIKFALKYLDGLIVNSETIDPELLEHAKNNGVSIIHANTKDNDVINNYANFYDEILAK